jgi:hypothetical protein
MGVKTSVEFLWLALMLRWENADVPDQASCTLDGKPAINSQIERMAYRRCIVPRCVFSGFGLVRLSAVRPPSRRRWLRYSNPRQSTVTCRLGAAR